MNSWTTIELFVLAIYGVILNVFGVHLGRYFNPTPNNSPRIVGGREVEIQDFSYQVSLMRGSHFCGGSIISSKYVLTAAHCTNRQKASKLQVRAGSTYKNTGGDLYNVSEIIQHQNYSSSTTDFDYSILKLDSDIKFSDSVQPIKMAEECHELVVGTKCTVSGWGSTHKFLDFSRQLRATEVPIVGPKKCDDAYKEYYGITDRMLCAGYDEGGKDSCQGDSGGPLIHEGVQHGIVSWGKGCAEKGYPGVYAKVSAVRPWIKENTGL